MVAQSPYQGRVKIFADGADRASMLELSKNPLVKGLTTNPSLMRKSGVKDYKAFCLDILSQIKTHPISFEVFADDFQEMHRQALEINSWGKNVYVKIPITNSLGQPALELIEKLSHQGVKLNVTALFTLEQVEPTVKALKGGAPSIVSVFAGRVADTGRDPMPLMIASAELCQKADKNIELLWASSRELFNVVQAEMSGCQIITCTTDIIKKMGALNKDLTELSLETVKT
ncbi:MAG: transaldolase, partial [Proteobacteria bacterium]|nr:transaldolase [Pseudomonadota bacterium]